MEGAYKVIKIDLTKREIEKVTLDANLFKRFIGGFGVGCKLYHEGADPGVEPFSPKNPVIIGAGVLVGSFVPSAGKIFALTKCPLPGGKDKKYFVGYGSAGSMKFGWNLKRAGYDFITINGRSKNPCYILIEDKHIEICDASDLWSSKDTYETTDIIQNRHKGCGVITIGQAGEKQVSFAMAMVDKNGTLGRIGVGAVLGSKNVKAIAAKGTKGVKISNRERLSKAVNSITQEIKNNPFIEATRQLGVHAGWGGYLKAINAGIWSNEKWDQLYGFEKYGLVKREIKACTACLLKCKVSYTVRDGRFSGLETESGHYILCAHAGQKLNIEDHRNVLKLLDICNRSGMCFSTTVNIVDWVTRLYSTGRISEKHTGGMILNRDFEVYLKLFEHIANREGFGKQIGLGWYELSDLLGIDANRDYLWAGIVKGVDTLLDARFWGLSVSTFAYLIHPRPHHGNIHSPQYGGIVHEMDVVKNDLINIGVTNNELERVFTRVPYYGSFNLARMTKHIEDRGAVVQSLGVCDGYNISSYFPTDQLAECYSAVTGIETNADELKKAGERICNLYKCMNFREGFSRNDDQCPEAWFNPIDTPEGEASMKDYYDERIITRDDINLLLDDYYDERGWDIERGIPNEEKLRELQLEDFI